MPTIELPSAEVCDLWGHRVIGVMLFPENEAKREEYNKLRDHKLLLRCLPHLPRDTWTGKDWKAWAIHQEQISNLQFSDNRGFQNLVSQTAMKMGLVAGAYLLDILLIESSGYGGSGVKAEYLARKHPIISDDGTKFPSSEKSIRSAWREYKSAGHLWCALYSFEILLNAIDEFPLDNANIERFLSLGEYFRKLGENLTPGNTGIPLLDPSTTWKPPSSTKFPEISADLGTLSETERRSIEEYLSKFR